MNPVDTSSLPKLVQPKYIKDGQRTLMTDTGFMKMGADFARKTFGKLQGGKYSKKQYG